MDARAVVLPADLALNPPAKLRDWLAAFKGSKVAVPRGAQGWILTGAGAMDVNQAALTLRTLAEGREVHPKTVSSGWMIVVYIAAGLFAAQTLLGLITMGLSFFMD
jgi:hypothetical protein